MAIDSIFDSIVTFDLGTETYKDHRCRLDLLHKDANSLDVLISPHGADLKEKKDTKIYLRILADGSVEYAHFSNTTVEEIIKSDGQKYLTLKTKSKNFVLPYQVNGNFPFRIMPGEFIAKIAESTDNLLGDIIKLFEEEYNMTHGASRTTPRELLHSWKALVSSSIHLYDGLKEEIHEAFEDVATDNLKPLSRFGRNYAHWHLPNAKKNLVSKAGYANRIVQRVFKKLIVDPMKHLYYSTEDNRLFGIPNDKEEIENYKTISSMIKSESLKAYDSWRKMPISSQKTASQLYHTYMFLGSAVALVTGNIALAAGVFMYQFVERKVAKHNAQETGYNTGIIGTIRDKTGLYSVVPNPADRISEDYDLGMWRKSDLD